MENCMDFHLELTQRAMLVAPDMYEKAGLEIPENGYESWEALEKDLVKLKRGHRKICGGRLCRV